MIASTNRDLEQMVLTNQFRSDLYFRLSELTVVVPPLRERKEDLPLLIDRILEKTVSDLGKEVRTIAPAAYKRLLEYDYPGNVRELENILQKGIVMAESDIIQETDVAHAFQRANAKSFVEPEIVKEEKGTISSFENIERHMIVQSLKLLPTKKEAARALGISRDTLYRKMKKFGLEGLGPRS